MNDENLDGQLLNIRILVVDDSQESLDLISNFLKSLGFATIYTALDAIKGQQMLVRNLANQMEIDLVLVDWNMPKVTGLDFLKRIRSNIDLKELPFIMVTADSDPEHVKKAIELGVNNYIVKPVTKEGLLSKIKQTMQGKIKKRRNILY
ncbi:MAG: response regulator [Bacteriovoracaceae bacterium]